MSLLLGLAFAFGVANGAAVVWALVGYFKDDSYISTPRYVPPVATYNQQKQIASLPQFRKDLQAWKRDSNVLLAEIFGEKTVEAMRAGRDPWQAARMAASFAFLARPELRIVVGSKVVGFRRQVRRVPVEIVH
jgi:hypothetical protein